MIEPRKTPTNRALRRFSIARTRNWGAGFCLVPTWHESNRQKPVTWAISVQLGSLVVWAVLWRRR